MAKIEDHTKKASYIMGFRESNEERKNALIFMVSLLRKYFPELEIIVVEQDDEPKLILEDSLNVRQTFFQNSDVYNHSRAYNEGAKITDRDILIFATADIFLSKEDYETCFHEIQYFEALTPNWSEISNVRITDPQKHTFEVLDSRQLYTFAGGILYMTRAAFEKAGGWDERFEGWGCEDDAMSHVIFNKLTSKSLRLPMYHIDHPKGKRKQQKKYAANRSMMDEIASFHGHTLDRYIDFLQVENGFKEGIPSSKKEKPTFVLSLTTFNQFDSLKKCLDSFFKTRNPDVHWQIIIADDGSTDQTADYLQSIEKDHGAIIIRNKKADLHRRMNTILKKLEELNFDLCFQCNDHVLFIQKGWDLLYWKTIQRTGYDHLIYHDKKEQTYLHSPESIRVGELVGNTTFEGISSHFYTLTKRVLQEVGYYDEQLFDKNHWAQVDFSFRCCRAGFNVLANPFDVKDSSNFLQIQPINDANSISFGYNAKEIKHKRRLAKMDRLYIPFNQNHIAPTLSDALPRPSPFPKADSRLYFNRGIGGFLGFLIKRLYNFGIDTKLYFIPRGVKKLGRVFTKLGNDLLKVDE